MYNQESKTNPLVNDFSSQMNDPSIFFTIEINSGCYQVHMDRKSVGLTEIKICNEQHELLKWQWWVQMRLKHFK